MRRTNVFATAEAAEEAFYDAMRRGDLAGMMSLWSEDEDVLCIHPGGLRLAGLAAIRDGFEAMFSEGGIDVRPASLRIHLGGMLAVHTLLEQIIVEGREGTRVVECAATNVYVKGPAGWRIVLHHAGPGTEADDEATGSGSAVLH